MKRKSALCMAMVFVLILLCASCGRHPNNTGADGTEISEPERTSACESTEENQETAMDHQDVLESIREKWPFYFGLNTEKGFSILVTEDGWGGYIFSVVPDKDEPVEFFAYAFGAGLDSDEVKALIAYYALSDDEIVLHPCGNVFSSQIISISDMNVQEIRKIFDDRYAYDQKLPEWRNMTEEEIEFAKKKLENR